MSGLIDLTGKKFGRLRILALHPERYRYGKRTVPQWLCRCNCGAETIVRGCHLRSGNTTSCGCARIGKNTTHGLTKSRAYRTWHNMKNRCLNPNVTSYPNYGGRGISFDKRWREFEAFYADVGDPPVFRLIVPTTMEITVRLTGVGPIERRRTATDAAEQGENKTERSRLRV